MKVHKASIHGKGDTFHHHKDANYKKCILPFAISLEHSLIPDVA